MSKPILIGNHIKPKRTPTRTEIIFDTPYVFANKNNDGHFITEVTDPRAAELMLSQPHHFYPYPPDKPRFERKAPSADDEAQRLAAIEAQARAEAEAAEAEAKAKAAAAEAEQARIEAEAKAADGKDPALVAEAKALLAHDAKKMATELQKLSGVPAMQAALDLENAAEKPRAGVVKLLQDAIAMATGNPA